MVGPRRLECLLSCRFLCIFGRFAKFSSVFLHSWVPLEFQVDNWKLGSPGPPCNSGERWIGTFTATPPRPGERLSHPTMAIPPFFSYTVGNGAWWTMAAKRLCSFWHCLFPNFVVEYKISFLVTGRSQYLEASKQAKNCWWFGYTLYPHIMFERGLTKLHRIFRMTHIDDANVIPCCCLWQNWFSCVLASMPPPLMFELRILLKTHGVYIKKTRWKVTSAHLTRQSSCKPRTQVDVI